MNYQLFLNQAVVNKRNESGIVKSIDETYIVVEYKDKTQSYNREIAFKNKFLIFNDPKLNQMIDEEVNHKEQEQVDKEQADVEARKEYILRKENIRAQFFELQSKMRTLKRLFGDDYIYKPYVEFVKRYQHMIN